MMFRPEPPRPGDIPDRPWDPDDDDDDEEFYDRKNV